MRVFAVLVALAVLLGGALAAGTGTRPRPRAGPVAEVSVEGVAPASEGAQPNAFYDSEHFYRGLREVQASPGPPATGTLLGGVVPHHILAGAMFSHFFVALEQHPPKTVVVVGPNHENRGDRIITGRRGWNTDFGVVESDRTLVNRLVAGGLAHLDENALSTEHSVGALMPYLKYHAPQARVVPIIVHKDVSLTEMRRLADLLAPLLGPDCVLVASIDFSHYLTRAEAEAKDVTTLRVIRDFNIPALQEMGPDHIDSPASLGLLMLAMQQQGISQPELVAHTNSGVIIGSDLIETTSYFTFTYRRPER